MLDHCNNAGVIRIDWDLASFVIGEKVEPSDLVIFDGRIEQLDDGTYWLTKFVAFQYKTLSPKSPPQAHILNLLEQYGLTEKAVGERAKGSQRVAKALDYPLGKGRGRG